VNLPLVIVIRKDQTGFSLPVGRRAGVERDDRQVRSNDPRRRAGLRIGEALDLAETDLDRSRGAVLVRRGKGGKRREVGMDRWAWDQLQPWFEIQANSPVGALLCVIHGATAGRHWEPSAARKQLRPTAALAGRHRHGACRRSFPGWLGCVPARRRSRLWLTGHRRSPAPMPPPAPVTSATRPLKSDMPDPLSLMIGVAMRSAAPTRRARRWPRWRPRRPERGFPPRPRARRRRCR